MFLEWSFDDNSPGGATVHMCMFVQTNVAIYLENRKPNFDAMPDICYNKKSLMGAAVNTC